MGKIKTLMVRTEGCIHLVSAFLCVVAFLTNANIVFAQGSESASEQEIRDVKLSIEEVTVFGARLQNEKAVEIKRDTFQLVDAITQDEIGRLPDFNVGDALRRAAGIGAIVDEDETTFVSVRGLNPDFSFVTLDGASLATANEGESRRVFFEFLPASVLGSLEVIKTRTPDMDGNTIGGQVNLKTRSAFDTDDMYAVVTGSIGDFTQDNIPFGFNETSGDNGISGKASGIFSNQFGPDNQWGVIVAGDFLNKDRDEERAIPIAYAFDTTGTPTESTAAAPGGGPLIWSAYHQPIRRYGGFTKIEFQPDDKLYSHLQLHYFFGQDWNRRNSNLLIPFVPATFTSQTTGSFNGNVLGIVGEDHFTGESEQYGGRYTLEYQLSDTRKFDLFISRSEGKFTFETDDVDFNTVSDQLSYDYNITSNGFPEITFQNPAFANNPASYPLVDIKPTTELFKNEVTEAEINFASNYGHEGLGYKTGVKYRKLSQRRNRNRQVFSYTGGVATLADFRLDARYDQTMIGLIGSDQLFFNTDDVLDFFHQNQGDFRNNTSQGDIFQSDYTVAEQVYSAYVALDYVTDRYQTVFGVRYELTDVASKGLDPNNGFRPISDGSDYSDFLPSVSFNYDVTENIKLRLAYSKALGRANIDDLKVASAATIDQNTLTLAGGNPHLRPRKSDNFDVSLEYYFDEGASLASVAAFHKEIDNEIFNQTNQVTDNGVTTVITIPRNSAEASITGVEINFVKSSFAFLPAPFDGLGFSGNLTYIDASSDLLASDGTATSVDFVFEQPELTGNMSVFYQYGPFESRISYSYTGEYHADFAGNPRYDDVVGTYDTWDITARYNVTDNLLVIGEIRNVFDENRFKFTGPGQNLIEDFSEYGKSFFVGASYRYR